MADDARTCAALIVSDVVRDGAYINLAAKKRLAGLQQRDRSFALAAASLTVENLDVIDAELAPFIEGKRVNGRVRDILRVAVCQLLFMDVPQSAAVNCAVESAKKCGKGAVAGFVNGVLRNFARSCEKREAEASAPQWAVDMLAAQWGAEQARAFFDYKPRGVCVRADEAAAAELAAAGAQIAPSRYIGGIYNVCGAGDITSYAAFQNGTLTPMGEASAVAVRAIYNGQQRVLDVCAAPGGKSAYIYALSGGTADITARDLHPHRVAAMEAAFERLHVAADTGAADAREFNESWSEAFDLVLVDAPCSGLGVAHKKADMWRNRTPEDIVALAQLQAEILETCSRYVAPGGTFAYLTCTVTRAENEAIVSAFAAAHPEFSSKRLALPEELDAYQSGGMVTLLPQRDGTDGFFAAAMVRA